MRAHGDQPTVVDARFVKPLDAELLERLAASHERIVTIEENALAGGFGSAVLEQLGASVPIVRFGLPDAFVPHGDRAALLQDLGLTPQAVAIAASLRPAGLTRVK
jgi:1-deoxy-D-xylulose-5-phosphate synthase